MASRYVGDFIDLKLNKRNDQWWTVHIHGFSLGSTNVFTGTMTFAIIDTGTSLFYLPPSDWQGFASEVQKAGA